MTDLPSTISITYDGNEISTSVEYSNCSFESQLSAQPGTFELTVNDPDQVYTFVTGKEVTLTIDAVQMFGGYVTQVSRTFATIVDTSTPSQVKVRQWVLRGVDYNILFDKLVFRVTTDYTHAPPNEANTSYDGDLVQLLCSTYLDIPAGFDTTTLVANTTQPAIDAAFFQWKSTGQNIQGTTWRYQMDYLAINCGTIYYINAAKQLVYKAIEDAVAIWGFSDVPNNLPLNGTPTPLATYGFRELDATEDGSAIVNDALVWGGSAFGATTNVLFDREQNATSESTHGRWQYGEANFGDNLTQTQAGVDYRARVIVSGSPKTADPSNGRGLVFPQWSFRFAWFAHDVPVYGGNRQHLIAGQLVTIVLYVMADDNWPTALVQQLPLRSSRISFITLNTGLPYIRFDGMFGLQATDPFTLWRYLLSQRANQLRMVGAVSNDASTTSTYGSFGQFTMTPAPDGTNKVFTTTPGIGYIDGTQIVTLNLLFQRPGFEYTTSDPSIGQITFTAAPAVGDDIFLVCRTL